LIEKRANCYNYAGHAKRPRARMLSKEHHILIVEDHADSAEMLSIALRRMGHRVESVSSGKDAVRAFQAADFDVLLLDLGLPDGDGCQLLQELTAIRPVPAIAITGYGMAKDIDRSRAAGFVSHITKPLMLAELKSQLAGIRLQGPPIEPPPAAHKSDLAAGRD
jgi:CheY-like chemotaxis protein